jgi:hypothetical protein
MLRNQDPSPYKEIDIKGMEKELERKWNWKRSGYGAHKKTNMVSQLDNVSWKWNGYGVYKKTNMVSQLDNVSCPQGEMERKTTMERKQNL